jgi:uncharacterized membrane protein
MSIVYCSKLEETMHQRNKLQNKKAQVMTAFFVVFALWLLALTGGPVYTGGPLLVDLTVWIAPVLVLTGMLIQICKRLL